MCQLTVVDTKEQEVNKVLLVTMLSYNSFSDGDGFGVINSSGDFLKSGSPAYEFLQDGNNYDTLMNSLKGNFSASAHCRLATVRSTVNDANAHPFITNNLTLMHNGSLQDYAHSDQIKSLFTNDMIDSERAANVISSFIEKNNNKFSAKVIEQAMGYFNGAFNFLIQLSSEPNIIRIVKGVERPLSSVQLLDENDTPVGFILNSRYPQLSTALHTIKLLGYNWKYVNYKMEDLSCYSYTYGTYCLYDLGKFKYDPDKGRVVYNSAYNSKNWYVEHARNFLVDGGEEKDNNVSSYKLFEERIAGVTKLLDAIENAKLSLQEADLLAYLVYSVPLAETSYKSDHWYELIYLINSLSKLADSKQDVRDFIFSNRYNRNIQEVVDLYNDSNSVFPYHFN